MSDFKETAAYLMPKEYLISVKDDKGLKEYKEYIVNHLSSELAERIMGILEHEKEIIISQSDLRVSEVIPLNSVEYRRQINWNPLVRCKDCKYKPKIAEGYDVEDYIDNGGFALDFPNELKCPCCCEEDPYYSWMPDDNWFCANGIRKKKR